METTSKRNSKEWIRILVPMVGERSSTELEIKLTRRLLLPTPESPINKILNERSKPLPCPADDPIIQSQTKLFLFKKKQTRSLFFYIPFLGFQRKFKLKTLMLSNLCECVVFNDDQDCSVLFLPPKVQ